MTGVQYKDFLVDVGNPKALDETLAALPSVTAQVIGGPDGPFEQEDGHYVVRVFGNPGFFKFSVENQGYCRMVGERPS
jgi:hypothetical protein